MDKKQINRRQFLTVAAVGVASTAVLAACGATPTATPLPKPTAVPTAAAAATKAPAAAATAAPAAAAGASGKLEIFSWWTSGGEVEALNALYKVFQAANPNVTIVNAAIGGGGTASGGDMKAVLQTRMMGGDPPESFQVHLGGELQDPYLVNSLVLPIDDLYTSQNYVKLFPQGILDTARYKGHYYAVPVNIHRANMFWYNMTVAKANGIDKIPTTWEDFMTMGDKLVAKGIPPMVINENAPGGFSLIMESVFIQYLGADKWFHLFDGGTSWADPAIGTALNTGLKLLGYLNPTYLSDDWNTVNDMVMKGKALGIPNGDWIPGIYWAAKFTDFGYADNPGCLGIYMALADSFVLPKGAKNAPATMAWLAACGSRDGQDAFNPIKGSISARTDSDMTKYSDEQKWMAQQWAKDKIVPSITHGSAAKLSFMTDWMNITNQLAAKKTDVATTWKNIQTAAANAKFGG